MGNRMFATAAAGAALAVSALWGWPCTAGESSLSDNVILDTKSFWRFRTVWEAPELVLPSGQVKPAQVNLKKAGEWFQKNPTQGQLPGSLYAIEDVAAVRLPAETPADWMAPGFDDSAWARLRGPMLNASNSENWKLILLRGLFEVRDPAKAGDLSLSVTFRGGVVAYLNGEEVGRAFLPQSERNLYAPAEPYSDDVYFNAEGFTLYRNDKTDDGRPRIEKRVRRLADCRIPAAKLRQGTNVLAIAISRAPTPAKFYASRPKGSGAMHDDCFWAKIGLAEVRLVRRTADAAVVPNTGPVAGRGFRVWNQSIIQSLSVADYPDPFSPLNPIRLTAVRNGTFAGQIVAGDEKPMRGLKAEVSDLKGPGPIPASAVQVRYALPDGAAGRDQPRAFDSLEESPPDEVPVYNVGRPAGAADDPPRRGGLLKEIAGSAQPIWITVKVPADARPGDYTGTVTVAAEGVQPVAVPLALRVIDWKAPDTQDYTVSVDAIESPESVAMAYDVPLWSDAHLKLLDKTFALLAPIATKTVYVTCVRRTHFGNEHAMVRWQRDDEGELRPDFSIVEKYLDVALGRLGKIPGVILYAWEPPESQGHAGGTGGAARTYDRPILITVVDPATGRLSERQGPAWGTPEAKEFWKKLTDGIASVLRKRGLEGSMLFGLVGDTRPTQQAMDDICAGVPHGQWAVHSHRFCDVWKGYPMGLAIALWGIGVTPVDPSAGYSFGWSNPLWLCYYPREMNLGSTLVEHRVKLEKWMAAKMAYTPFLSKGHGPRGLGRIGADFWVVLKDVRGRATQTLAGRYPESAWGQLNLNFCIPHILGKGKTGPLATVRSEAFREGLQEFEARVFVEKALLDDVAPGLLGDALIGRCRRALDERIRMCLHSDGEGQPWYISSDWNQRTELLFGLAAEVARKLGREPRPNLAPEPVRK